MTLSKMLWSSASFLLFALLPGELPLFAEVQNGNLTGAISDQSGGRLAQATVTVRNAETAAQAMTRPTRADNTALIICRRDDIRSALPPRV